MLKDKERFKKRKKLNKEDTVKRFRNLKLFTLVGIVITALVFIGFNFVEGQVQTLGKPDKTPGKPKGHGTSMDAISEWPGFLIEYPDTLDYPGTLFPIWEYPGCPAEYADCAPGHDRKPGLPPNLFLIDTRDRFHEPYRHGQCKYEGVTVPLDSNQTFIVDFGWNSCMSYSYMEINVPEERAVMDWEWLHRGEMAVVRNEAGWIVEIFIWFYDQDGWGYETGTIEVEPVMPNSEDFVIRVCRTDIPIFPRGHKKYWKDWCSQQQLVDCCLGRISIGDIHFIPRQ